MQCFHLSLKYFKLMTVPGFIKPYFAIVLCRKALSSSTEHSFLEKLGTVPLVGLASVAGQPLVREVNPQRLRGSTGSLSGDVAGERFGFSGPVTPTSSHLTLGRWWRLG